MLVAGAHGNAAAAPAGGTRAKPGSSASADELPTQLGRVVETIEAIYVDPVDRQRLFGGAVDGIVRELDPHSEYMDAEAYAAFRADSEGAFGGIGIEVDLRGEQIRVLAPIEGAPAEAAGVRTGDQIIAIDGEGVDAKGFEKMVKKLRGEPGTKVTLSVKREGIKDALHITVTRAVVHVTSVRAQVLAEGILYIRVKQFQEGTADELIRAVAKARKQAGTSGLVRGVLLDLRGNPGGLVDEATQIADEFLSQGTIYTLRARGQTFETATATAGGLFVGVPTIALLDEWSASASELLAGALQDAHAATIVGRVSFGKGSVQTILDLPGGAGIKLTTARYYTPAGHAIQGDGIHPEVEVVEAKRKSSEFPSYTERDLTGALPPDPSAPPPRPPVPPTARVETGPAPEDLASRRAVPNDPRTGDDPMLKVAFERLTKR